jgi:DNA repair exonuclease SbcCD ATPase subunit
MTYSGKLFFASLLALSMVSCKSLVTLEDVNKQEQKARAALENAEEEAVELANVKEQYSGDKVKVEIERLEKEHKTINSDIKKLKGITTESAVGTTAATLKNLENRNEEIEKRINSLKKEQPENWESAKRSIQKHIEEAESQVNKIVTYPQE